MVVVTRLDRLARSTRDLLNASVKLASASLRDDWADTTTPHGRLMLTVLVLRMEPFIKQPSNTLTSSYRATFAGEPVTGMRMHSLSLWFRTKAVSASVRTYSGRIRACTGRARPCAAGKSHNY